MFTSSWSNPQQNQQQQQQQQQQTSAFGQPSAFGATTNNAFGTTSAFGQPQQPQQQPQVNPMFGNIGAAPNATTNTGGGFGTFGSANNTNSAFGAKPATGFGAFGGGTGAFGGGATTSAFGQPPTNTATPSVFGQPANTGTTSAFGGGNALFGGNKSTFGSSLAGATTTNHPVVTTGTANPPYSVVTEKDGSVLLQFQTISCMTQYAGYSLEELRVQDYAQNRKTASTGAFGSTAFGTAQPATTGAFGTQPAQQPAQPLFGAATTNTNAGFGGFGQTNTQPAATATNPLFGGGSAFSQTQPAQQQSAFGTTNAFGQQPPQQASIFGGGTTGNSTFGNTASKPAFTPFGGGTTANTFGTTPSTFGNTQQQQPTQTGGLFGNTQPAANTNAFGTFGNAANTNKPSIFGGTTTATQPTSNVFGTGAFGAGQPQQNQQPQQPSIFGNSLFGPNAQQPQTQQQPAAQTSIFGNTNTTAPVAAPSLFGAQNTGGLFGNTQQQVQQQPAQQQNANAFGNLFSAKPVQPTAPLFGSTNQTASGQAQQPSLFGGNTFGQSTAGNSLFGTKQPAAPTLGNSLSGSQVGGMNIFGAPAATPGGQGTLTASITQPIGENLPIFAMLPPGPRIVDLDQNGPKKKAGFFLDMPTRSPVPRVQLGFTPASSKLRGFGSSTSLTSSALVGSSPASFTSGKLGVLSLNKSEAKGTSVGPDFLGRSGSPSLGSGGRQSVKKVILDKKVEPSELFVKSGSPGTMRAGKVTFSPALSVAAREKDSANPPPLPAGLESPTPVSRTQQQRTPNRFTAQGTKEAPAPEGQGSTELGEGDYYVKPDLEALKKAGHSQLSAFEGLVVGRKGYGTIHFLEPVDLTGLPKLGALLGEVVRFDDKECSVYPDSEEVDKPSPGSGLNVKAKIALERCWAVDKATREPITDEKHPAAIKHLRRLKNIKDTHFENFDMTTGTWTFTVDHF